MLAYDIKLSTFALAIKVSKLTIFDVLRYIIKLSGIYAVLSRSLRYIMYLCMFYTVLKYSNVWIWSYPYN